MINKFNSNGPGFYRWVVFAFLAFGYLLVNFHRLCPAVVATDLMKDLKASGSLIGLLASAYFYPYAFMQLPSGLLSDSWGPRKTITGFFLLAGVASIGFGFAQTSYGAILSRVFVGIGVSMLFVPIMKILTGWFKVSEFSFMTGLLIAIGGLGSLTAASPLAYLSETIGWRGCFVIIGAITVIIAGAIWVLVRDTPEEMGYPSLSKNTISPKNTRQNTRLGDSVKAVLGSIHFWPLAIWFFFTLGIFFSFGGLWGGPYLMEVYGLSKPKAGSILSMLSIAMIIGSPLFSFISDRVVHSRKKILILSSICLWILTIPLVFSSAEFDTLWLYVWSFGLGLFGCAIVVIGFASAKELFPVEIAGTAVGLVNLFPFLGGAIMQPLIGLTLDTHGKTSAGYSAGAYRYAFLLYFVSAILALISSILMKETFPSHDS